MDLFGTEAPLAATPEHDLLLAIVRRALNDIWHKKPSVREGAREYWHYAHEDYDSQNLGEDTPSWQLRPGPWGTLSHCCCACEGATPAKVYMRRILDLAHRMLTRQQKLATALVSEIH